MKRILLLLLLLVFAGQILSRGIIYLTFKINQDYIAQNLCVKKEIENNDCKGNCCLKKELEKEEKNETPVPHLLKEKIEYIQTITFLHFNFLLPVKILSTIPDYKNTYRFYFYSSCFHPPSGC